MELGLFTVEVEGDRWDYADCFREVIASSYKDAWKQAKERFSDRKIIRVFLRRVIR